MLFYKKGGSIPKNMQLVDFNAIIRVGADTLEEMQKAMALQLISGTTWTLWTTAHVEARIWRRKDESLHLHCVSPRTVSLGHLCDFCRRFF